MHRKFQWTSWKTVTKQANGTFHSSSQGHHSSVFCLKYQVFTHFIWIHFLFCCDHFFFCTDSSLNSKQLLMLESKVHIQLKRLCCFLHHDEERVRRGAESLAVTSVVIITLRSIRFLVVILTCICIFKDCIVPLRAYYCTCRPRLKPTIVPLLFLLLLLLLKG